MDDKLFQELASSINEAGRIRRGAEEASRTVEFSDVNVRLVRAKTGLSQLQFASLLGVSAATLRNWGRDAGSQPTRPEHCDAS